MSSGSSFRGQQYIMRSRNRDRDEEWMGRAIELAARGRTSPNPMVGAVLVKGGRLVGEAYHRGAGKPHAEVLVLRRCGKKARGATLYVNLEPCAHTGRTPPCTDAIREAGVAEVIAAMRDPNPLVSGRGVRRLRSAGVRVHTGVLRGEAQMLNEAYIHHVRTGRPFVTVKAAMSLDGKLATRKGESRWISCPGARKVAHRMRGRSDAIMVGAGTAKADDPLLTVRPRGNGRGSGPLRVVVDSLARLSVASRMLKEPGPHVLVAVTRRAPAARCEALRSAGAEVLVVRSRAGRVDLAALMWELGERGVLSVLIEGGGELIGSALAAGIVSKFTVFIAPKLIGGRTAPSLVGGRGAVTLAGAARLGAIEGRKCGSDILVEGYVETETCRGRC